MERTYSAVRIALEYGERIGGNNLKSGSLVKLVGGYPDHGFVIDRSEAQELFENVRVPTPSEQQLVDGVGQILEKTPGGITFTFLDQFLDELLRLMPTSKEGATDGECGTTGTNGTSASTSQGEKPPSRSIDRTDGAQAEGTTTPIGNSA